MNELREKISRTAALGEVGYEDFRRLQGELRALAITVFGAEAEQVTEVSQLQVLTPEEFSNVGRTARTRGPKLIHSIDRVVTRIVEMPEASKSNYYRKRLVELTEVIVGFMFSFVHDPRRPDDEV